MPIEDDGKDIKAKPSGEAGAPPASPANPNPKPNESNTEKLEKDIKRGEWWLIRIGIATLLINTVIAVIYWGQLQEMRKATRLTGDAVKVARDTLTETQASNTRQVLLADQVRQDANTASDASRKDAARSLQATIDNLRLEQRAWVVPYAMNHETTKNGYTTFHVLFKNTGHTPAFDTRAFSGTTDLITGIPEFDPPENGGGEKGLVPPEGVGSTRTLPIPDGQFDPTRYAGRDAFVYGTIWYSDVFGKNHWTQFCYKLGGPTLDANTPCIVHFTTDDEQKQNK